MSDNLNPNINTELSAKNKKKFLIIGGVFCVLFFGVLLLIKHHHSAREQSKSPLNNTAPVNFIPLQNVSEFGETESQVALGQLNNEQDKTAKNLSDLQMQNQASQAQLQELRAQLDEMKNQITQNHLAEEQAAVVKPPLEMSNFQFQHDVNTATQSSTDPCPPSTCVLPGSFVRAVLIGAADADASVDGQSSTTPILFKVLENGTLPNGYQSHLKGCFVVGSVYGDISSERGEVKLQTISCIKNGVSIVKQLNGNGLVYDDSGRGGIKGVPYMNTTKLLWDAGLSGFASGIGSALSQSATTQSVSPLGTTTTVNAGQVAEYGAASGASQALGLLAQYYIKRANQYHPVIQLNPGAIVDLMFIQQFNLAPDLTNSSQTNQSTALNSGAANFNLNSVNLGSGVSQEQEQMIKAQIQQAIAAKTN